MLSGGKYITDNTSFYLYDGNHYWTISPNQENVASMFVLTESGSISTSIVSGSSETVYVRPVISLKHSVTASSGDGSTNTPYVIN